MDRFINVFLTSQFFRSLDPLYPHIKTPVHLARLVVTTDLSHHLLKERFNATGYGNSWIVSILCLSLVERVERTSIETEIQVRQPVVEEEVSNIMVHPDGGCLRAHLCKKSGMCLL